MKEVGPFKAKNKFGQLLDWVEVVVAARIRARRKGVTLGGVKLKDLIAEGRL